MLTVRITGLRNGGVPAKGTKTGHHRMSAMGRKQTLAGQLNQRPLSGLCRDEETVS